MRFPYRDLSEQKNKIQGGGQESARSDGQSADKPSPYNSHLHGILVETAKITYTLDEVELIKQQAFAAGQAEALQFFTTEAQQCELRKAEALQQIATELSTAVSTLGTVRHRLSNECIYLAIAIARKIVANSNATLIAEHTLGFIRDILDKATPQAPVLITVHESIQELVKQACSAMIERKEVEVVADPTLALSDCKIEWSDGMVVKNAETLLQEIEAVLIPK